MLIISWLCSNAICIQHSRHVLYLLFVHLKHVCHEYVFYFHLWPQIIMTSHPHYPLMNFSLCFNTHGFNYQPYKGEYSFMRVCVIKNEMKSFDLFYNECMWCMRTSPSVLDYSELKDKGDQWQNHLRSSLCAMINFYIIIYVMSQMRNAAERTKKRWWILCRECFNRFVNRNG